MKYTFETEDLMEAKRMVKSLDVAIAMWDILHNTKKKLERSITEETTADDMLDAVYEAIGDILVENNVDINDIIE